MNLENSKTFDIRTTSAWSNSFFKDFIDYRKTIYQDDEDFIPESIDEIYDFFSNDSFWSQNNCWQATLIFDTRTSQPVARFVTSFRQQHFPNEENARKIPTESNLNDLHLGFFECSLDEEVIDFVVNHLTTELQKIKTENPYLEKCVGPIQGSIFLGARFREKSDHPRFLTEPVHREKYPEIWERMRFVKSRTWNSYKFPFQSSFQYFKSVKKEIAKRLPDLWFEDEIKFLKIDKDISESDLHAVLKITLEAYDFTGTGNEIDEKIFAKVAQRTTRLVVKDASLILKHKGRTVGFCLCYRDIQHLVRELRQRKLRWPRVFHPLAFLSFLFKFQFSTHPIIKMYIAKAKNSPIKFLQPYIAATAFSNSTNLNAPYFIAAYLEENSKSNDHLPQIRNFILELF